MVNKVYSDDSYVRLMPCINPSGFFNLTIRDNEEPNFHEVTIELNEQDLTVLIQDLQDKLTVLKVLNHSI